MHESFLNYLNHNVPEYQQYVAKYGSPGLKRVNKMVQGIKLPCDETLLRGTTYKEQTFSMSSEFSTVEGYINYFRTRMQEIENELRDSVEPFIKISSFQTNYRGELVVNYEVQESSHTFKKRLKENERIKSLNALIPLVQAASECFQNDTQERINEQRKLGIKKKMEALQRELNELDGK